MSKGKGFAGHIKRHHFHRGPKSHGSDHHREPGSIGPGTTPGRVYKGLKMAGHMGDERATIKKVRVVRTDPDRNLLLVKGSLPGRARLVDPREEGLTRCRRPTCTTGPARTSASVELSDELFAAPVNAAVLHQVVTAQLAGRRLGTADTKTRGEVRGGGRKPYRQKGTGRARQGSISAPHYRGGGVVFGPHPRSYEQRLPRKMKRLALRGALTAKFGDEADQGRSTRSASRRSRPRTSPACSAPSRRRAACSWSSPARDEKLELSARNLPTVEVILADSLNVVDLLKADVVLIEQPSLARMQEVYA